MPGVVGERPGHVQPGRRCPASPSPAPLRHGALPSLVGSPPPSPLCPQPHGANPSPNPMGTSLGDPKPAKTQHEACVSPQPQNPMGGSTGGGEEGGRALPSPAGVPRRPCGVGLIVSSGEAGKLTAGPAEKPPGWFSGVGAARLTSEAATSRLGPAPPRDSPGQRRKRLLIPRAGEVLPYLSGCHISTTAPSLAVTHPCRKKKNLLSPAARQAPFCSGRKRLPPFRPHTCNPRPPNCRKPPSSRRLGVKT